MSQIRYMKLLYHFQGSTDDHCSGKNFSNLVPHLPIKENMLIEVTFWSVYLPGVIMPPLHAPLDTLYNPFTLRAAKRGLTILEIFSLQKHFFENI